MHISNKEILQVIDLDIWAAEKALRNHCINMRRTLIDNQSALPMMLIHKSQLENDLSELMMEQERWMKLDKDTPMPWSFQTPIYSSAAESEGGEL